MTTKTTTTENCKDFLAIYDIYSCIYYFKKISKTKGYKKVKDKKMEKI